MPFHVYLIEKEFGIQHRAYDNLPEAETSYNQLKFRFAKLLVNVAGHVLALFGGASLREIMHAKDAARVKTLSPSALQGAMPGIVAMSEETSAQSVCSSDGLMTWDQVEGELQQQLSEVSTTTVDGPVLGIVPSDSDKEEKVDS